MCSFVTEGTCLIDTYRVLGAPLPSSRTGRPYEASPHVRTWKTQTPAPAIASIVPRTPTDPDQIAAFQEIIRPRIRSATLAAPPRSANHKAAAAKRRPSGRFRNKSRPSRKTRPKEAQPSTAKERVKLVG